MSHTTKFVVAIALFLLLAPASFAQTQKPYPGVDLPNVWTAPNTFMQIIGTPTTVAGLGAASAAPYLHVTPSNPSGTQEKFEITGSLVNPVAQKPNIATSLVYVAQTCAGGVACVDTNDGLSLSSAKATIYAAIRALPGGADYPGGSAGYAGVGTVYVVGPNVAVGGPVANQGIWLMGSGDPNFASPPLGWLKWGAFGIGGARANLKIEGLAPMFGEANGRDTMASIAGCGQAGGGAAPSYGYPPCVWISGLTGFSIENIDFPPYRHGSYVKLGITSTGDRTYAGGSSGIKFSNLGGNGGSSIGDGPCFDIGSNVFWVEIDRLTCHGNGYELYSVTPSTGLSRSSGVVTVTTTTTNDLYTGQNISVWGAADGTFNGNFVVISISGSPQTAATWAQAGPNATSGGGYLWNDRAFTLAINPGTGTGSGSIHVEDLSTPTGGIRLTCGTNGGGVDGGFIFTDAPFGPSAPTLEFVGPGTSGHCIGSFRHVEQADVSNNIPTVVNWGAANALDLAYVIGTSSQNVFGPATVLSQDSHTAAGSTSSPVVNGQTGVYQGYNPILVGRSDVARRLFSSPAVRFSNLAPSNPASWSQISGTLTTGVLAPDGTNGAATWISSTGFGVGFFYTSPSTVLTPGDWWIGGVWTRAPMGVSTPGDVNITLGAQGYSATGDYCYGGTQQVVGQSYEAGDGQWFWVTAACKIWSGPLATSIGFGGGVAPSVATGFYGPVFINIPARTLSDNEVAELINDLSSYPPSAVAGDVSTLPAQRFGFSSGSPTNEFLGYLAHSNTANRTYTFPDSSFTVAGLGINQTFTGANTFSGANIFTGASYGTSTNCSSSASPAVCGSAAAGSVAVPTGSTPTLVVDTSAVTANSQILLTIDESLGTKLSVTCNTTLATLVQPVVTARTPGTSFTIQINATLASNPACVSYSILN